jgi:hypothetical protein
MWHIWEKCIQGFYGETYGETDHLKDLCIDGRIILEWIFKMWDVGAGTGLIWLG